MSTIDDFLRKLDAVIVNPLIYLLFGVALIVFLWGVVQYLVSNDSEEGRTTGKRHILWGVVGMFIMASAFGILHIIVNTFGIDQNALNSVSK